MQSSQSAQRPPSGPIDVEKNLNTTDSDSTDAQVQQQAQQIHGHGFGPAPEGGLKAWLAVAGSASIFFSCLGFLNSFGVFQEYYMANQLSHRSSDDISWIGSLMSFIQFAGGAFAGPLFDRYGSWVCFRKPGWPRGVLTRERVANVDRLSAPAR